MLNSKNGVFSPYFFNWYLSNEKTAFVDKSRVEPTIFFIEKISFSFKLFSGHFMGNPSLRLSEVLWNGLFAFMYLTSIHRLRIS